MFTVQGDAIGGFCDGISRRNFLKVGAMGLGFGGVGLPDMLRLQASQDNPKPSYKAVINLHLEGGPPQMDTFDMKPDSSLELRGEFSPIRTKVPGTHICELLPNLAKLTDKFTIIRSVIGNVNKHNYDTTQLGYPGLGLPKPAMRSIGGAPSIGGVISKLLGGRDGMPAYVWDKVGGSQEEVQDGWLGPRYAPFDPKVSPKSFEATIPEERLHDRIGLLGMIDKVRRTIDNSKNMEVADQYTQEAVNMVLSGKVAEAMDLTKEPESSRAKYIDGIPTQWRGQTERLMLARRLVEAGARYVSLNWGGYLGFDSHDNNYPRMRSILPPFDMSLSALITDLYERGLDKDVLVVAWGEFGRTPKINKNAGRDHWGPCNTMMFAGAGVRGGNIVGATDHLGAQPTDETQYPENFSALIYDTLGIPRDATWVDMEGRPHAIYRGRPIAGLA